MLQNSTNEPDLMEKGVQTETEQSPTAARVGDIQSTPEEDETNFFGTKLKHHITYGKSRCRKSDCYNPN